MQPSNPKSAWYANAKSKTSEHASHVHFVACVSYGRHLLRECFKTMAYSKFSYPPRVNERTYTRYEPCGFDIVLLEELE